MNRNTTKSKSPLADNLSIVSRTLDSVGLSAVGWLCHWLYLDSADLSNEYTLLLILNTLLVLLVFPNFELYFSWRGRDKWKRTAACFYAWSSVIVALLLITFTFKVTATFSRVWFISFWVVGLCYVVLYRFVLDKALNGLRANGRNRKKILIYGGGKVGRDVGARLQEQAEIGFDIVAYFDDKPELLGMKINGATVEAPEKFLELAQSVHEIWIALPFSADKKVQEILFQTRHLTQIIRFIPDIFHYRLLNHSVSDIAGIPIININGSPISYRAKIIKRLEDIVLGSLILALIIPVMVVISIIIKLTSKGPLFYKQKRHGWDGISINVYKFRSMYYDKNDTFKQATKNDSRITPIGRFIRKTSIDELPQFFNVLQGRMSIVGPRPHAISMNEEFKDKVDQYMQRHKMKPGITGWAQVNGYRGETDTLEKMEKRIEYDLYYIENWSIFFDLQIIILTVIKGFTGKNAY